MEFIRRTEPPAEDNDWYYDNNIFWQCDNGLPNCTCYAYGRANELTGRINNLSHGNAIDFWEYNIENDIYPYGPEARLGALVVFNGVMINPKTDRPYGHIAVVEEVYPDGSFDTSESAWSEDGGEYWYESHYTPDTEEHGGIVGFIYYEEFEEEDMTKTEAENYVRTCYIEYLGREADEDGLLTYSAMLENEVVPESFVDNAILGSEEYDNVKDFEYKKWFIIKCYSIYLDRYPSEDEINAWAECDRLRDIHSGIYFSEEAENRR